MKLKYVRTETLGFVLWSEHLPISHMHMAAQLAGAEAGRVTSAGFVRLDPAGLVCYGYSTSLEKGPAPDDGAELARQMSRTALSDLLAPAPHDSPAGLRA